MAFIDNLVAYWKMDEASGNDRTELVNGYTAVETGGSVLDTVGKIGNAAFWQDASTFYLNVSDADDLSPLDRDWSMYCWFRHDNTDSGDEEIAKKGTAGVFEYDWQTNASGTHRVFLSDSGSSRTDFTVTWSPNLSDGTWYFGAWGNDPGANEAWISINAGTPVTQGIGAGGIGSAANATASITIGSFNFAGAIDEMAIFTRDIRGDLGDFYNSGIGLPFPFRELSSQIIWTWAKQYKEMLADLKRGLMPPDVLQKRHGQLMATMPKP